MGQESGNASVLGFVIVDNGSHRRLAPVQIDKYGGIIRLVAVGKIDECCQRLDFRRTLLACWI